MHNAWLMAAACAGLVSLVPVLRRLRAGLRQTALAHAWYVTLLAWMIWTVVSIVTLVPFSMRGWADILWYLSAIAGLVAPIATLGARRPINRAWTWFVLLPLVLVFTWPVMPAVWTGAGAAGSFDIETPLLVGFLLVSVMGPGNYVGLAHTVSALLWVAALWMVVLPLCPTTAGWAPQAATGRAWGTVCLIAAGWVADRQVARRHRNPDRERTGFDCVWRDFRELFGIVWARRILERFNDDAHRQGLPFRLAMHGLQTESGEPAESRIDAASLAAAESALRWNLQKFVDPEWIDQRV